jgi:uncharacterized membrane protein (UPF0127 family)
MSEPTASVYADRSPTGKRLRALILLAIGGVLIAISARTPSPPAEGGTASFKRGTLVLSQDGRRVVLKVEVADTPEARAHGLMFRKSLRDDEGMLFVFTEDDRWAFWMKNTLVPLSIAFMDRNWRVVDIQDMPVAESPEHGPFPVYQSKAPARYALEVAQGFFTRKKIGVGARVQFTLNE